MILQRLAEHYDRIAASSSDDTQLAPPGFSRQKISFCVVLNPDGSLNQFKPMKETIGKSRVAIPMIVPGQNKPTGQGINPCFLWDNTSYMLGWTSKEKKASRAIRSFAAFRAKHLELESRIGHPSYTAVCSFLRTWSPEMANEYQDFLEEVETGFGVFKVAGQLGYVHEVASFGTATNEEPSDEIEEPACNVMGMCLVSSEIGTIARLHEPKIQGVANSPSYGALLVSCKDPAYRSYGKTQGYNAPVGSEVAFKYATALNHLLNRPNRRVSLGDSTVVYWADHDATLLEEGLNELFGGAFSDEAPVVQEDEDRLREARLLLKQLRDGTAATAIGADGQSTRFFLLGLSPNASRISVRLWVEADAAELQKRLGKHLRDIELDGNRDDRLLTLRRMVAATGRWDDKKSRFNTDNVSPQLAGDLARSVLTGAAYPQSLLAAMLRRMHSDGEVNYARVAAIKACLVRNSRLRGNPLEVSKMLDRNNNDAAYCCGRAFALLEIVQRNSRKKWKDSAEEGGDQNNKADGAHEDDGPTIRDYYFSSASTTPSLVLPRLLLRLYPHHLAKLKQLNVGLSVRREQELGEIMNKLNNVFPRLLSLEDQGKFVIGYFHQRQDLYTSKKDKQEGAAE